MSRNKFPQTYFSTSSGSSCLFFVSGKEIPTNHNLTKNMKLSEIDGVELLFIKCWTKSTYHAPKMALKQNPSPSRPNFKGKTFLLFGGLLLISLDFRDNFWSYKFSLRIKINVKFENESWLNCSEIKYPQWQLALNTHRLNFLKPETSIATT